MKRNTTDIDLGDIEIQPVDMRHHRMELRSTLLASPHWRPRQRDPFLFLRGVQTMRKRTWVVAGLAVSFVAMAFVFAMVLIPQSSNTAFAEELAQRSYQAVATLTPEQQGELSGKLRIDDPKKLLEEARNAKDLKTLTYDQFASQQPMPPDADSRNGKAPDLHNLTFLRFTDKNGSQVTLGIDPRTQLPAVVAVQSTDPSQRGPVKGPGATGFTVSTSNGDGNVAGFQTSVEGKQVQGTIDANGKAIVTIDGKKYTSPDGAKISTDTAPQVRLDGNDMYIDGVKLVPDK